MARIVAAMPPPGRGSPGTGLADMLTLDHATGTDAVTEITDMWTFERDLSQQNPVWHLVAARSA